MSSLVNLKEVHLSERFMSAYYSSFGQTYNFDELHKAFKLCSVRHLTFKGRAKCPNSDLHMSFLRMFPNLETLINPPVDCLKGDSNASARLRKLVLLNVRGSQTNDIMMCVLKWQALDALLIHYEDFVQWPLLLMDGLRNQNSLRHLCVVVETSPSSQKAWHLPTRVMIGELADAWANRDWVSMVFIWGPIFKSTPEINMISAIHHDDGNIKYDEMHEVTLDKIVSSFPQFYTLFWQYIYPYINFNIL